MADPTTITGDPPASPPAEEPKPPVTETPETPATEAQPLEGDEKPPEGDEPPAVSAFDKLTEGLTDPDEIEAVRERLREKLPEDRRQPKAEPADEAQNVILAEQRRREQVRQNETQRDGAVARLNGHLKAVKQRLTADDPSDPKFATLPEDYDPDLLTGAINEIVQAEIALADQGARELFSTALFTRLQKHGGPLSNDDFKALVQEVADNKVEHGIVGAYLDRLISRAHAEGLAEGEAKASVKDNGWRKAETAAVRAELMRERELEPDGGVSRPVGSKGYADMTPEERGRMTSEEIDAMTQRFLQTAPA